MASTAARWKPGCGGYRLQELGWRINRRGFAADPRSIPAAESEVLPVPAKVGIVPIIGSAKTVVVMGSDMVNGSAGLRSQTIPISWTYRAGFITGCKGRTSDSSGQDSKGGKYLEMGHWFSP